VTFSYSNLEIAAALGLFCLLALLGFLFRKKINAWGENKLFPFIKWLLPPYQQEREALLTREAKEALREIGDGADWEPDFFKKYSFLGKIGDWLGLRLRNNRGWSLMFSFFIGIGMYFAVLGSLGCFCGNAMCYSESEFGKGLASNPSDIKAFLEGMLSSRPFSFCCLVDRIIGYPLFAALGALPAVALNWYWRAYEAKTKLEHGTAEEARKEDDFNAKSKRDAADFEDRKMSEAIKLISEPPSEAQRLQGYIQAYRILMGPTDDALLSKEFETEKHKDFFEIVHAFYEQLLDGDTSQWETMADDPITVEIIRRMAMFKDFQCYSLNGNTIEPGGLLMLSSYLSELADFHIPADDDENELKDGLSNHIWTFLNDELKRQSELHLALLETKKTKLLDAFVRPTLRRMYRDFSVRSRSPATAKDTCDKILNTIADRAIAIDLDVESYRETIEQEHAGGEAAEGQTAQDRAVETKRQLAVDMTNEAVAEITNTVTGIAQGKSDKQLAQEARAKARSSLLQEERFEFLKGIDPAFYSEVGYTYLRSPAVYSDLAQLDNLLEPGVTPQRFIENLFGSHPNVAEEGSSPEMLDALLGDFLEALNEHGYGSEKVLEKASAYMSQAKEDHQKYFTDGAFGVLGKSVPSQFHEGGPAMFFVICVLRSRIISTLFTALHWMAYLSIKKDRVKYTLGGDTGIAKSDGRYHRIDPDNTYEWYDGLADSKEFKTVRHLFDLFFSDAPRPPTTENLSMWMDTEGNLGEKGDGLGETSAIGGADFLRLTKKTGFVALMHSPGPMHKLDERMHSILMKIEDELRKLINAGLKYEAPWARRFKKKLQHDDGFTRGRHVRELLAQGFAIDPRDTDGAINKTADLLMREARKKDKIEEDEHYRKKAKENSDFEKSQRTPEQINADAKKEAKREKQKKIRDNLPPPKDPKDDN
jgi:hypothetical protein